MIGSFNSIEIVAYVTRAHVAVENRSTGAGETGTMKAEGNNFAQVDSKDPKNRGRVGTVTKIYKTTTTSN